KKQAWWDPRKKKAVAAIKKIATLQHPIAFGEMRDHKQLGKAPFIKARLQGSHREVTAYWPQLYSLIVSKNPAAKPVLKDYTPDQVQVGVRGGVTKVSSP